MGGEAVQLLGDIALLRQQDQFLLQALRIEFGLEFGEAVEDLLPLVGQHGRHQFAQVADFHQHRVEPIVEQLRQLQAFARAAGLELLQGLAEGFQGGGVERLRIGRVGHQYAGPGQHGERIERRRLADQGGYSFGGGDQLAGALLVDLQALAGGFLGEAQGAFHLATRQALAQRLAHRAFEVAEGVGQAQVGLQVTVVDRAQLPAQGAVGTGLLDAGEGGHAVHHGSTSIVVWGVRSAPDARGCRDSSRAL